MFNRRKGWKLWVAAGMFFFAVLLPWLGTVWPAFSSKTIPEWAVEHGISLDSPQFAPWFILVCSATGLVFLTWFFLSPQDSGAKSPLILARLGDTQFRHLERFGSIRVKNESPDRSAQDFKAEVVDLCEPEKWKHLVPPVMLTTSPPDIVSINPGSSAVVDILKLWSLSADFDETKSLHLFSQLPTRQPHNVLSYGGPDVTAGETFSIVIKLTARDFIPAAYRLTCKMIIVPNKRGRELDFEYQAKCVSARKY